tara:strand:+ start:91 stop:1077 length:987 start_codon:yes stop_codon:yes gene_type:complete
MHFLVTGGAGYIGSHMVDLLQQMNNDVTVLDNFSTGNKWSVQDCEVMNVDLLDKYKLNKLMKKKTFDGIFHFAALSIASESVLFPQKYLENNVLGTKNLIKSFSLNNEMKIIFSSSASVYGNPQMELIDESHPTIPINPYGKSKLEAELLLKKLTDDLKIQAVSLRYFNVAGAHNVRNIGEYHEPETHLIPSILNQILKNKNEAIIYGNDYNTIDGTCIRDYIHVQDLVRAHFLAFENLSNLDSYDHFNLGNGNGFSVLEIIKSCERVTEKKITRIIKDRRIGDVAKLVSSNDKAKMKLNWIPRNSKIDEIITSAWKWHKFLYNYKRA